MIVRKKEKMITADSTLRVIGSFAPILVGPEDHDGTGVRSEWAGGELAKGGS